MTGNSVEVQLARVDERLFMVLEEMRASKDNRKAQYETMENLSRDVRAIAERVGSLERAVATAQPTIAEFVAIKQKVIGAGLAGKWLWVFGGLLLGLLANSREAVFHWLKGSA
jgi:hypothetical protein